ncbi:MAG: glycosyltransferase family 2 protein [Candidatus Eisenbacteria sp.]|nr:glycosyltransferase family 2 protein [Candidatus Eisenbacteria bacterium]
MNPGLNTAAEKSPLPYDFSFAAPAYNESVTIEGIVRRWQRMIRDTGIRAEIIITNDGSSDNTAEILHQLADEFSNLKVVDNALNQGYGGALKDAIREARGRWIVTLDSDGQFDIAEYAQLYDTLIDGKYDVVTGYRDRKRDSFVRFLADRALNVMVRILFGVPFRDTNCALKIYRPETLQAIEIESGGFSAPTEILLKIHALGYRIGECEITHYARAGGATALKVGKTGWEFFGFLLCLKRKIRRYRRGEITEL